MAKELKEIFEAPINTIGQLRAKISDLKEALKDLTIGEEDYKAANQELINSQKQLHSAMKTVEQDTKDLGHKSFNELNIQLANLKEKWKAATDEVARGELTEEINKVKSRINEMNHSIGNFQDNVGNYTKSITDAFKQMGVSFGGTGAKFASMAGILTGGLSKLGGAFKSLWTTLAANPIGAVIVALGALVGALSAVRKAVKENEELERRYHEALAAFRPLADKFRNWMDKVAAGFVAFTEAVADAYEWLRKAYAAYTDWMGITEGEKERVEAEQKMARALGEEKFAVMDLRRETEKLNQSDEEILSTNRELASMTSDVAKRTEYLKKAREAQIRINERNVELAQKEYEYLKKDAETTANSIDTNNKLLEAELKVSRARTEGRMSLLRLNRQIESGTESLKKNTRALKENTDELLENDAVLKAITEAEADAAEQKYADEEERFEKAKEIRQAEIDARKTDLELEEEAYQAKLEMFKEFGLNTEELEANHLERMEELRKAQADREQEAFEKHQADMEADDKATEAKYEKLMKARETATKNMAKGTSSVLKNLSVAMGEQTKMGKGFAIAAATIDTIAAAVTGFRAGMNQWADAGPLAFMAPIQAALNAAMALTAGFAEVQKIRNVDTSGNSQGGGSTAMAVAIPNIEGLSTPMDYTRQVVTETEQEEMNRNNRVYILESDIQESGNRVRVREEETTF